MKIVFLDGGHLTMDAVSDAFRFPPYFGKNLDALYDCLTEIGEKTVLCIDPAAQAAGSPILTVIRDAARENKNIVIVMRE